MSGVNRDNDRTIDKYDLDNEWQGQSALYEKYATQAADAREDFDQDEAALDLVIAEYDIAIRKNPESFDLPTKLSEKMILSAILLQDKHKVALAAVIESRRRMNYLNGIVKSLDSRKTALSKLVDLFLASYFSKPVASEQSKEYLAEEEKRAARRKARVRGDKGE